MSETILAYRRDGMHLPANIQDGAAQLAAAERLISPCVSMGLLQFVPVTFVLELH
jgi:hypothetical protein